MSTWRALEEELDAWADAGLGADFWWRDDDAVEPTPALDRLLDLSARHGAPLALAVIPARGAWALGERIAALDHVTPVQHGFAHRNHAPGNQKKAELGAHRAEAAMCEELARGRALMAALFGSKFLPVLVPPWNRIAPGLVGALPGLGLTGLSVYGPRGTAPPAGLAQLNSHIDIMRWRAPRGFLGEAEALDMVRGHLLARRQDHATHAAVDRSEPTGILTHHLAHDDAAWNFLERLLNLVTRHPAAKLADVREVFGAAEART